MFQTHIALIFSSTTTPHFLKNLFWVPRPVFLMPFQFTIQCSPFITHLVIKQISTGFNVIMLWLIIFTMEFYKFVKLSLYNTNHLYHGLFLWTSKYSVIKGLHCTLVFFYIPEFLTRLTLDIPDKKRNAPRRTVRLTGISQVIGQFR